MIDFAWLKDFEGRRGLAYLLLVTILFAPGLLAQYLACQSCFFTQPLLSNVSLSLAVGLLCLTSMLVISGFLDLLFHYIVKKIDDYENTWDLSIRHAIPIVAVVQLGAICTYLYHLEDWTFIDYIRILGKYVLWANIGFVAGKTVAFVVNHKRSARRVSG